MLDDGEHGDRAAGDRVYGADFLADQAGEYHVKVIYRGSDACGAPLLRTTQHLVPVLPRGLSLKDGPVASVKRSEHRLEVRIPTSGGSSTPYYRVLAEVWGTVGDAREAIAWIGGLTASSHGTLRMGLDTRWIARAGARAPFELRNVRVEDPDFFITVAFRERMPLSVPDLQSSDSEPATIDEEMRMGPRPPAPDGSVPASFPLRVAASPHKLLLVHGYCSDNVWGGIANQFPNSAVFSDFHKNRTIDNFARKIRDWARSEGTASYAIVAHSQGGMAALHLYTYYWSGLDDAGSGRLLQSVGTPYQGTSLADFRAELGAIFGAGCGSNYDLTYGGAAQWLAGISPFYRARVNYYTTSFRDDFGYDYCHLVTDRMLTDPDDGVVEAARGQLPGGANRGHAAGWCHSGGMHHGAQCTDAGRNKIMGRLAAVARP